MGMKFFLHLMKCIMKDTHIFRVESRQNCVNNCDFFGLAVEFV